jgi:hypothetical protein
MELGFESTVHVAAGVAFSLSWGISGERTMSISHGDSTIYSGSIGSIESDTFPDNQYEFGLFTYLQSLEGREFEVINYWVNTYD